MLRKITPLFLVAAVLRSGAKLTPRPYFNYFPHGNGGKAPGVTVRSGDWKLFRWFETNRNVPEKYELYNLRADLGESKNLAAQLPEKVKELDALIDAFLVDTRATYPRPNPAYRPGATAADGEGPVAAKKKKRAE